MKSLKDILAVLLGIAAALGAIFYFYRFVTDPNPAGGHTSGWIALVLAAVAFVCGLIYFLGHVSGNKMVGLKMRNTRPIMKNIVRRRTFPKRHFVSGRFWNIQ